MFFLLKTSLIAMLFFFNFSIIKEKIFFRNKSLLNLKKDLKREKMWHKLFCLEAKVTSLSNAMNRLEKIPQYGIQDFPVLLTFSFY